MPISETMIGRRSVANPRNASKTKGKRWYTWNAPDGENTERYWSVTTIIGGGVPKPALIGWAAKITAVEAIGNLNILNEMVGKDRLDDGTLPPLDDFGKPTGDGCMAAYEYLTKARFRSSGKAADLGTEIHECIEAWVLDKPLPDWRPEVEPYMESVVDWLGDFEPKVEMSEASVYNRTRRYAGTLDMIATIGDERYLIDFKTGSGVYPEAALQMAAYAHAEFVGSPDGTEVAMPKVDGALIIHVQPDHYEPIPVRIDDEVFGAFLYAREVFRWMEDTSKSVIGDPLPAPQKKAVAS